MVTPPLPAPSDWWVCGFVPVGVAVKIMIDHPAPGNLTISEIQLYDTNNNLWLKKPENIMREDVTAGILYRFTFDFHEN
mgnify:CR=1 FL=1